MNYEMLIDSNVSISHALASLDKIGTRLLFVIQENRLIGTLADSDLRRYFMFGGSLEEKVTSAMNKDFKFMTENDSYEEINDLFSTGIEYIPIVNQDNSILYVMSKKTNKYYPVSEPNLTFKERSNLLNAFDSGWISSVGPFVTKFEDMFENYLGFGTAVAVSNGTQGLALALHTLGIRPGDEIIVPDLTFGATANAVIQLGAVPVIADVESDTWNISIKSAARLLTQKTKAIIPVHLYGQPCEIDQIQNFAKAYQLLVIEDAAEALGSKFNEKHVGNGSDAVVFSFYGNKLITTGEGGMVVFKDKNNSEVAKTIRSHGFKGSNRYWHEAWGTNMRLTNLQASIGVAQLERIDFLLKRKIENAKIYMDTLNSKLPDYFEFPAQIKNTINSFWLFTLLFPCNKSMEFSMNYLQESEIETRRFFNPLHIQPAFSKFKIDNCGNSLSIYNRGLCLPSSTNLTKFDILTIVTELCHSVEKFNEQELSLSHK